MQQGDSRLQLMEKRGIVKDIIDTEFIFEDVDLSQWVLSPQGELLLSDTSNKQIKSISQNKVRTLFRTQWAPWGLCCLHSGDVAVTFFTEGEVIIYNRSGKRKCKLNMSLLKHPYRLAQNKVNNDLYICDKDATFYNSTDKIIALDAK